MRRRIAALAAGFAVILTLVAGGPVAAARTPDQAQDAATTGGAFWGNVFALAQTFTPNTTGKLDTVELRLQVQIPAADVRPAVPDNLTVAIFATTAGLPSGSALATGGREIPNIEDWYDFAFTPPPDVVKGTVYAIVASPVAGAFIDWPGVCGSDPYTRGEALIKDSRSNAGWMTLPAWALANQGSPAVCQEDFAFRSYVTAPGSTAPPTSTSGSQTEKSSGSSIVLLFAGFAAAAAFVTARRMRPTLR